MHNTITSRKFLWGYLLIVLCWPVLGAAQGIQKHASSGMIFFIGGAGQNHAPPPALLFTPPPLPSLTATDVTSEPAIWRTTKQYDDLLRSVAEQYDLPFALVKAVALTESHLNRLAVSHKGAQGIMQLMPQTTQALQVSDPFDPMQNIDAGARVLRRLLDQYNGELALALAAYNAGEGAVAKYGNTIPPYPETQHYVRRVQHHIEQINGLENAQKDPPAIKQ